MNIIDNVKEIERKKLTFVSLEDVCKFLALCAVLGIACYGGAFDHAFTGQWFYTE